MANLSPSELASLLGPIEPLPVQRSETVRPTTDGLHHWNHFAEEFARTLTARLRPLVKAASRVQAIGLKTQTAEFLIANHDLRSVVGFWQCNQSVEPISIILSPSLVTTFVDRLLGGRTGPHFDDLMEHRPLTEIDYRLAARLLEAARQCVIAIATAETPFEINELPPQSMSFEEAWLPDCSLLRLSFDLRFVQGGGSLELLVPLEVAAEFACEDTGIVEGLRTSGEPPDRIDQHVNNSSLRRRDDEPLANAVRTKSPQRTTVVANLARMTLPAGELRSMAVGDVLLTDAAPDDPLEVIVDDTTHFPAHHGGLNGHKAIQLLAPVSGK